ncbi:MAG: hypothetical protein MK110_14730 [Fuerstiella sp.]|nr:hypothetical protein [Fuerstiella sp.]
MVQTTVEQFQASIELADQPPLNLTLELQAMWYAKSGHWEEAHNIAQEIHTPVGSWIHALLHLIEGDVGNAGYWFRKAGRPTRAISEIDSLWTEITGKLLQD